MITATTGHAKIQYDGKHFLKVYLEDDILLDEIDVIEQRSEIAKITKGTPHVLMVITAQNSSATKEAREYSSQNKPAGRIAEALVVTSLSMRLMASVYISFNKPAVPTRYFDNEKSAEKWLQEMLVSSPQLASVSQ